MSENALGQVCQVLSKNSMCIGPCSCPTQMHGHCRIDQLLEQVDQGSQVVAVDPIQIAEDIAVPRRDSDLTAWVSQP